MKTIGLIGGMAWPSTIEYYRLLNEKVQQRANAEWSSAPILLYSVNFAETMKLMNSNQWNEIGVQLGKVAQNLESIGAETILLCSNTIHKIADQVEDQINIPLLHVADATGTSITQQGLKKVGLLGTKFTMEETFYRERLRERFGISCDIPKEADRAYINNAIYSEFAKNQFSQSTKERFLKIITNLQDNGCEGIILGCTEIPLLIHQSDVDIPLFNTLEIHMNTAVDFILDI